MCSLQDSKVWTQSLTSLIPFSQPKEETGLAFFWGGGGREWWGGGGLFSCACLDFPQMQTIHSPEYSATHILHFGVRSRLQVYKVENPWAFSTCFINTPPVKFCNQPPIVKSSRSCQFLCRNITHRSEYVLHCILPWLYSGLLLH